MAENLCPLSVYVAGSFRHLHAVQMLARELRRHDYVLLDWTVQATPPEGLSVAERRAWMDTDHGGRVFEFCSRACNCADLVIYFGASGQDAGVEVGMAWGAGVPLLGIRGPLEAPGLMLYGAVDRWVESMDAAFHLLAGLPAAVSVAVRAGRDKREAIRDALQHLDLGRNV